MDQRPASGFLVVVRGQVRMLCVGAQQRIPRRVLIGCSEPWVSSRPAALDRLTAGTFTQPLEQLEARLVQATCNGFPCGAISAGRMIVPPQLTPP